MVIPLTELCLETLCFILTYLWDSYMYVWNVGGVFGEASYISNYKFKSQN